MGTVGAKQLSTNNWIAAHILSWATIMEKAEPLDSAEIRQGKNFAKFGINAILEAEAAKNKK